MLRTLIVEDDFTSRKILQAILRPFGACDVAVNGPEALDAYTAALRDRVPYELICLDINMPGMDGHAVLSAIRSMEESLGIMGLDRARVIMTTASSDRKDVATAFRSECDAYFIKPYDPEALLASLREMGLADRLMV